MTNRYYEKQFVDTDNVYIFEDVYEDDGRTILTLSDNNGDEVVVNYYGAIRFFTDSNGVGHTWVGYDVDKLHITVNGGIENVDSDIVDHIAEYEFQLLRSGYDDY